MHNEQVFTPRWLAEMMLDEVGYDRGHGILDKTIMDNSCGEGVFLVAAVARILPLVSDKTPEEKAELLGRLIHGIEKDGTLCSRTIANLDAAAAEHDVTDVKWDIRHADALDVVAEHTGSYDFVVGNPPYANVHDLGADTLSKMKQSDFCKDGMTDLYLVFFEIGYKMLRKGGRLIYITPSSWTNSVAGRGFRNFLCKEDCLESFIHMRHHQVFDNAQVYTAITKLHKKLSVPHYNPSLGDCPEGRMVTVKEYDPDDKLRFCVIQRLPLYSFTFNGRLNGNMYFERDSVIGKLTEIDEGTPYRRVRVQNGFATLNDKLFVIEDKDLSKIHYTVTDLIPVVKASTGERKNIIFPYRFEDGRAVPKEWYELSIATKEYIVNRIDELGQQGKMFENNKCWLYGRTQALNDVAKSENVVTLNNLIRTKEDVKTVHLDGIFGVYGGFYAIADGLTVEKLRNIVATDEFVNYIKALGHYKSGGYYTFTSKEAEAYINNYIANYGFGTEEA